MKETLPLSGKESLFVREYLLDFNGKRAAECAGYKQPAKVAVAVLNRPHVKREIEKRRALIEKKFELTKEDVLKGLLCTLTRTKADFVDLQTGRILPAHLLSEKAWASIDGIEQDVYFDQEGIEHQKTKYKLTPFLGNRDLACKILGMLASQKLDINVTTNVEQWHDALNDIEKVDTVEKAIEGVKKLPHTDVEQLPDGSYAASELLDEVGESEHA